MASNRRRDFAGTWMFLGIFALAVAVRIPHLSQSLWYDEMYNLVEYVTQPWGKILAAGAGEYVPNNHVLHTVLAKLVYAAGARAGWCRADGMEPNEALLRLPSMLAGALLPVALAWPLRPRAPGTALWLALVVTLHPWMIAFSDEARGYSLLLLLAILATNALPDGAKRWPMKYSLALAAAIYTVPIGVLLVVAHAVAVVFKQRADSKESRAVPARSGPGRSGSPWYSDVALKSFGRGVFVALALVTVLYLPMSRGIVQYYRNPFDTTITYREFLDELPRFAMAGERLPRLIDSNGAIYWALPVLVMIIGSAFAWRREELRPLLITLLSITLLGIMLPLISPGATEVRFVPWAGLLFSLAAVAVFTGVSAGWLRGASVTGMIVLLVWMGLRDFVMLPNQPIREGIRAADRLALPNQPILMLYIGARESAYLYGAEAVHHDVLAAHDAPQFLQNEAEILQAGGLRPCVVIFYEDLARRRDGGAEDSRGLWSHLRENYRAVARLPGRVSPFTVYMPRETLTDPLKRGGLLSLGIQ